MDPERPRDITNPLSPTLSSHTDEPGILSYSRQSHHTDKGNTSRSTQPSHFSNVPVTAHSTGQTHRADKTAGGCSQDRYSASGKTQRAGATRNKEHSKIKRCPKRSSVETITEADKSAMERELKETLSNEMIKYVHEEFPDLHSSIFFVPPLAFTTTYYTPLKTTSDQSQCMFQQNPTPDSDRSSDQSKQIVRHCIKHIARLICPPMFVLFDYFFSDYLCEPLKGNTKVVYTSAPTETSETSFKMRGDNQRNEEENRGYHEDFLGASCHVKNFDPNSICQTDRKEYLSKHFSKAEDVFNTPRDLETNNQRGDFDVLIISQKYGVVVIEIKTLDHKPEVGGIMETKEEQALHQVKDVLRKKLEGKAIKQLSKAEVVLNHMFEDFSSKIPITLCFAFPNTPRTVLRQVLQEDLPLQERLLKLLKVDTLENIIAHFICSEDANFNNNGDRRRLLTGDRQCKHSELEQDRLGVPPKGDGPITWWLNVIRLMESRLNENQSDKMDVKQGRTSAENGTVRTEQVLSKSTYEQIIARFCGPYSKVTIERRKRTKDEVRTVADSIHLTGIRFGNKILLPDQLQILRSTDRFVYLSGPPGSGKTLILGLKAMEWAKKGHDVFIIRPRRISWGSLVSWTLFEQVVKEMERSAISDCQHCQHAKNDKTKGLRIRRKSTVGELKSECTHCRNTIAEQQSSDNEFKQQSSDTIIGQETSSTAFGPRFSNTTMGRQSSNTALGRQSSNTTMGRQSSNTALGRQSSNTTMGRQSSNTALGRQSSNTTMGRQSSNTAMGRQSSNTTMGRQSSNTAMGRQSSNIANRQQSSDTDAGQQTSGTTAEQQSIDRGWFGTGLKRLDSKKVPHDDQHARAKLKSTTINVFSVAEELACATNYECDNIHVSLGASGTSATGRSSKGEVTNIHCVYLSMDTDPNQFVDDLLERYPGKGLRLILDEIPLVNPKDIQAKMSASNIRLNGVRDSFEILFLENGRGIKENYSETSKAQEDEETNVSMEAVVAEIEHHLREIGERIAVFTNQGKKVTLATSVDWKVWVVQLVENYESIKQYMEQLKQHTNDKFQSKSVNRSVLKSMLTTIGISLLEASGLLLNVQTILDFIAVDDIFLTVVSEHADRDICVWSSGVYPSYPPALISKKTLQHCLRCPPAVQNILDIVEKDMTMRPYFKYVNSSISEDLNRHPLPTDGPEVKRIDHSAHVTTSKEVKDCSKCGDKLAKYFLQKLRIGKRGCLSMEDILICGSFDLRGMDCKFLKALSNAGINLEFESDSLPGPPPYPEKAFVVGGRSVQGLEAKIVVFVPDICRIQTPKDENREKDFKEFPCDQEPWLKNLGRWNRSHLWFVASRTLAQLIVFHV